MDATGNSRTVATTPDFLSGGGELGQMIRNYDWSSTSLGPVSTWPQSLRTCIRIMLTSRQPIWIGWGKDLVKFYNDPYKAIVGGKHPWALGMPASIVWKDIWKDIEPLLQQVMEKDQGIYVESQLLIMERNGYPEETYYTFSYTPIPGDDGGTAGMICANTDDTDRIITERQLKTLTQLGTRLKDARSNEEVIAETMSTLGDNPFDFPFAVFYLPDEDKVVMSMATAMPAGHTIPAEVPLDGSTAFSGQLLQAAADRKPHLLENVQAALGNMPAGAWPISSDKAIILPVMQGGAGEPYGFLVVGCNPYRLFDEKYSRFFSLVADQVATSFANVHALEEERKRAEALAEIDRAKTIFFSNVSHEFRTPLTLLLGPIEELLSNPDTTPDNRTRAEVAYRNALRMQKLVNSLMEFSRIEAGRMDGRFTRVDIEAFTADLASSFRSAIERAGMELTITKAGISDDVYVDMDMWEKIILNILSNALKYSRQGTIALDTRKDGNNIRVTISDTGIGIPEDQLAKIFNRFHRVENSEGRSQEGTGIGLALVKELVKLHGGSISVSSTQGKGSVFTIELPTGKAHLPEDKVAEGDLHRSHANLFLQEALKWADREESNPGHSGDSLPQHKGHLPTILFADDNADMRDYVDRLLSGHYRVVRAVNGLDAYEKALTCNPELILSDVMMPKLDGFGLIQKIRAHHEMKNIPVILLSARSGDEAKVDGLGAGADDYMVKPFSAKELLARVDANIRIAKNRIASENNLKNIIAQTPISMTILKGAQMIIEMANDNAMALWGRKKEEVIGLPAIEAFPELKGQGFTQILSNVYQTGTPFIADEMLITLVRNGAPEQLYTNIIYAPLRNADNTIEGIVGVGIDVTGQVKSRQKAEHAEVSARLAIEAAELGTYVTDLATNEVVTSARFNEIWGVNGSLSRADYTSCIHPDDRIIREVAHKEGLATGSFDYQLRVIWADQSAHWVRVKGKVMFNNEVATQLIGVVQDINEQKLFAAELSKQVKERTIQLQRSNEDLQQFAHVTSHDLKEPVRKVKIFSNMLQQEFSAVVPQKGLEYLGKIQNAANRMTAMIDGVLNYSTLNSSGQDIEHIDLNELLAIIRNDLELPINKLNAKITTNDLGSIDASPVLMYQLLYNLINNSLKFISTGRQPVISITSETIRPGLMQIVVADNGIGFAQEHAEIIFTTFTRLNSKDKFEGTGLGLALCKKIAERHGGGNQRLRRKRQRGNIYYFVARKA
jgi:PAS domain S-box-containing protein